MGWSEKDFCIKCDEGGNVLICRDSRCPIVVHEKCLGFPAKFDEMGRFYCPYCVYRRAIEEAHQAREKALSKKKALSKFLDTKMTNGDWQTQKTEISKRKELSQLPGVDSTGSLNSGCRPDKINVHNHTARLVEDQNEGRFAPECSRLVLLSKETGESIRGDQNDVLCSNTGDIGGSSDCNCRIVVVGHRTESGPIVASGNECVSSDREETIKRFEMVEIGNKVQLHSQWQQDDLRGKVVEDQLDDKNLRESPAVENRGMENHLSPEAKRVGKDGDMLREYDGRLAGEEVEKEKVLESPAISPSHSALEMHLQEKRAGQTSDSICKDSNAASTGKASKQNDKRKEENAEATCFRKLSRNSASHHRASLDQFEKIHACGKLRKLNKPAPQCSMILCPNARRKSLPWTDAEEEMLKEGVEKFSTDRNKNIPWRKILEFGRHVFDGSRTPVDLKDKWRNILGKVTSCILSMSEDMTLFATKSINAAWRKLNLEAAEID
nr:uncharacterized protein LOC113690760 isoform X1 [Coffea arabica]XP_027064594.1 uncharacterized protein LOC113690760 isoform X1 [Coffea arabica]XP_027064595.1 uncharacterized protein LOC113690760 isoform X1 [Coffea arabica]XP_027064596.1 uncharacterized protein LOC113690760 isoform X1 [Coffea arabica]